MAEARYPMRFAQWILGRNSEVVRRAYNREIRIPSLEEFEQVHWKAK